MYMYTYTHTQNAAATLVVVPAALTLCEILDLETTPFIVSIACFANLGGCTLAFSDFPNLLITNGIKGITFGDW